MERRNKMVKYALIIICVLAVVGLIIFFFTGTKAAMLQQGLATPFGKVLGNALLGSWWIYLVVIALCFVLYFLIKLIFGKKK